MAAKRKTKKRPAKKRPRKKRRQPKFTGQGVPWHHQRKPLVIVVS